MSCLPEHLRLLSVQPVCQNGIHEVIIHFRLINCTKEQLDHLSDIFPSLQSMNQPGQNDHFFSIRLEEIGKNVNDMKAAPDLKTMYPEFKKMTAIGRNEKSFIWSFRNVRFDLSRPRIMGILNVTPDSFSDGGDYYDPHKATEHALQMIEQGADIIDIGGESTRPGARQISVCEEIDRILPVIQALHHRTDIPISVDTYKSQIAEIVVQEGASIINDISGAHFDPKILDVVKRYKTGLILMHIKGDPQNMQKNPYYKNVLEEILVYLAQSVDQAEAKTISPSQLVIDPGIGFGKRWFDNYDIINRLTELRILGLPILIGVSRKSFIGKFLSPEPKDRLEGSLAANIVALLNGVNILRVHDVVETKRAIRIAGLFRERSWGTEPSVLEEIFDARS